MWDEVICDTAVDDRTRMMITLASLIGMQGLDEYRSIVKGPYQLGVTPEEIREITYQAVPYCGIGRVLPFLIVNNHLFQEKGISLPLMPQNTIYHNERCNEGIALQVRLFGGEMQDRNREGNSTEAIVNRRLSDNCFGDFQTRSGLDLKIRELMTFCYLNAL